jgi:hypothetical protein
MLYGVMSLHNVISAKIMIMSESMGNKRAKLNGILGMRVCDVCMAYSMKAETSFKAF